ncbi:MAG: CoA transferase [Betaproteobacteria bacterium]|nr:CoA transferase [Betaproteobacteria bacterium]MDH3437365.1 CoA transferase [Betaproteobacteria bacterium]
MAGGPLEGVRVLDLTSVVVGPLATQIMADHGAEVIKIEAPAGDIVRALAGRGVTASMSGKFLHLNRNKRSIALDLKQEAARDALMRLIERADVLIWNMRPPAMARLGLAYEDVRRVNPRIIYCGMFGFGQDGRYRDKPAYDSIIQGSAGIAALHHRVTGEPRYLPMVIADRTVGLIAVQMILMALYHRTRTGEGQAIEIPMFENIVKSVLEEHMYLKTFDPPLGPTGDPRLLDAEARPLATQDGWICISGNTDGQAFAIFDAIGKPELKADSRFNSVAARFKNTPEYFRIRAEGLRQKTTAEWLEIFDATDVPAMPFQTLDELMQDPHLKDIGFFSLIEHPTEGRIRNMRLPNKLSGGVRRDFRPAPKIGEHSIEILSEAGYDDAAIEAMVASRATVDGRPQKQ